MKQQQQNQKRRKPRINPGKRVICTVMRKLYRKQKIAHTGKNQLECIMSYFLYNSKGIPEIQQDSFNIVLLIVS